MTDLEEIIKKFNQDYTTALNAITGGHPIQVANIIEDINKFTTCSDLANYKAKVLMELETLLLQYAEQSASALLLTDPITLIANMVKQMVDLVTKIKDIMSSIETLSAEIEGAFNDKMKSLNCVI